MSSTKIVYMPQENSMIPSYLPEQNLRPSMGSKSGIWSSAPPATPQSSNASISSVWGSPLSVLPTASSSSTSSIGTPTVTPAFRRQTAAFGAESTPHSLAALTADSEPVIPNNYKVAAPSFAAPALSSNSSRISSRHNSQTDITSTNPMVASSGGAVAAVATPPHSSASGLASPTPAVGTVKQGGSYGNDEIINTAIVVKNIPFAIKKEQLVDFMTQLGLPLPYAFNYHFDNGVFRGLAFANFTTADETAIVISSLNGRELGGRKLRVEYKKMLPFQERERIDREKRERRGQLEEQHQQSSLPKGHNGGGAQINSAQSPSVSRGMPSMAQSVHGSFTQSRASSEGGSPRASHQPLVVDMNDQEVLQAYTSLLLFKRDPSAGELSIPAAQAVLLSRFQTHVLMTLSQRLDLKCQILDDQTISISKITDRDGVYKVQQEPESDYTSGLLKNAILTPSPNFAISRPGTASLVSGQPSKLNSMSALNRWNSVNNLVGLGSGSTLEHRGSIMMPK